MQVKPVMLDIAYLETKIGIKADCIIRVYQYFLTIVSDCAIRVSQLISEETFNLL